jgi:hypothetical protein
VWLPETRAVREDRRATAEVADAAGVACPVAREGAAPSVEPVNADINVKFEWIGAPSEIITSQVPGTVSFYTPFSDTRAVPPTATGLQVTYEIDGYDDQSNGQIFLDDMSVMITSIPEPASVILFGLGLLRLCGLRRR